MVPPTPPVPEDGPGPSQDLEIVRQALAGRDAELEKLARRLRCVPRILSVLNRRRGGHFSGHDLEDLTQDVLMKIWEKLETFRGHVTLEFWAHRFCYLESMNRLRRLSRASRSITTDPVTMENVIPAHGPEADERLSSIEAELTELEPTLGEVVRMKTDERLNFDQIGARLGVPEATAKSRYYRALTELRRRLNRSGGRP